MHPLYIKNEFQFFSQSVDHDNGLDPTVPKPRIDEFTSWDWAVKITEVSWNAVNCRVDLCNSDLISVAPRSAPVLSKKQEDTKMLQEIGRLYDRFPVFKSEVQDALRAFKAKQSQEAVASLTSSTIEPQISNFKAGLAKPRMRSATEGSGGTGASSKKSRVKK